MMVTLWLLTLTLFGVSPASPDATLLAQHAVVLEFHTEQQCLRAREALTGLANRFGSSVSGCHVVLIDRGER
jgi:hypothetical protein